MNIHTAVVNTKNKKILKENAVKFISADSNGAETVFIGRVRNENSGKKVTESPRVLHPSQQRDYPPGWCKVIPRQHPIWKTDAHQSAGYSTVSR